MLHGVVTKAGLGDLFRSLAQRRTQGVLRIGEGPASVKVWFSSGKVVEAEAFGAAPVPDVAARLLAAGGYETAGPEGPPWPPPGTDTYSALFAALAAAPAGVRRPGEAVFRLLVRERLLDVLHRIDPGPGAAYRFGLESVTLDPVFGPAVSVGQLLLDFVAAEPERAAFEEAFAPDAPVSLTGAPADNVSEEEEELVRVVAARPATVAALSGIVFLSGLHFRASLASLLKRGIIRVGDAAPEVPEAFDTDALFTSLDLLGEELEEEGRRDPVAPPGTPEDPDAAALTLDVPDDPGPAVTTARAAPAASGVHQILPWAIAAWAAAAPFLFWNRAAGVFD